MRVLTVHSPALAFTPDSRLLLTLRQTAMEFWRMPEGTLMHHYGAPTNGNYSSHLSIAISPKSDRIVTVISRNLIGGGRKLSHGDSFFNGVWRGGLMEAWALSVGSGVTTNTKFNADLSTPRVGRTSAIRLRIGASHWPWTDQELCSASWRLSLSPTWRIGEVEGGICWGFRVPHP